MVRAGVGKRLADYDIVDEASFDGATSDERRVAGLYFYMLLDTLVDLAHKVSLDFFARPQLYTNLADAGLPGTLAKLRARYGHDEKVPSREQRLDTFTPLFGPPGEAHSGEFARLRDDLNAAASAFSERVFDTGEEMLRERVRSAHRPFKAYLVGLSGSSLSWSRDVVLPEVAGKLGYSALKDLGVVSVFGIAVAPSANWPYAEDSNADKAVAAIAQYQMPGGDTSLTFPLTRERFSQSQRSALRGAEALATIADFDEAMPDEDLNRLITKCYTWGSALHNSVTPDTSETVAPPA